MKRKILLLAVILLTDMILAGMLIRFFVQKDRMPEFRSASAGEDYIEPKYIALTFDDGPNRKYTEKLLDGLKERGVKASFFLVGKCIDGNEEIVKRMAAEGHFIGVHCMQHTDLTKESEEKVQEQLRNTSDLIGSITGETPEYIRPPYGSWNARLDETAGELGLVPVFWSVDSLDWKLQDIGKIVKKVTENTKDGDIILMHDEFSTSVEAAFRIIDNLMAKGYTFVTVDELMID